MIIKRIIFHNKQYILNKKINGMISLELIFILGILVTVVSKIVMITYQWVNKFYILNKILIIINGFCQFNIPVNNKFNKINISTENQKLKIQTEDKILLNEINSFLKNKIQTDNNNINYNDHEIIISNENPQD